MRVGILFRGPLRPSITNVLANRDRLLANFAGTGWQLETWLTTWNTWLDRDMIGQLPPGSFDAVITQPEPRPEQALSLLGIDKLPSTQTTNRLWKTMLSAKVALDAMLQSARYDYIVHARTDGVYDLQPYLMDWFRHDAVATKHVAPRVNDFIQIGPAHMIQQVWDYQHPGALRHLVSVSDSPENILERIAAAKGVRFVDARCTYVWVDLDRNVGDPMT